jgi:hypothetical protein
MNKIQLTVLIFLLASTEILNAQALTLNADYPLINNLMDNTSNNNDVFLEGNPTAPTPPSTGVELCHNGIYIRNTDGQNIQTPVINAFNIIDFQLEVEFKPAALPPGGFVPDYPVIVGGSSGRWIGILVDINGRIGLKFNNFNTNNIWTNTFIAVGNFYHSAKLRYQNGNVELFIDGVSALNTSIPALQPFQNDFNFTTTDFSNGRVFNGCIKNLKISSVLLPDLLWDNTNITATTGGLVSIQGNNLPANTDRSNSADDFVIPIGETWNIEHVVSEGFSNGTIDPNSMGVAFYNDNSGIPGSLIAEEQIALSNAVTTSIQNLTLVNPVQLSAGSYWISIYASYDNFTNFTDNKWFWRYSPDKIGADNVLQDTIPLFGGFSWASCDSTLNDPTDPCFSFNFAIRGSKTVIIDDIFSNGFE